MRIFSSITIASPLQSRLGNSMAEYIMPVALVGLVGFACANAGFFDGFLTFTTKTNKGLMQGKTLIGSNIGVLTASEILSNAAHDVPEMKADEEQVCFAARGVCVNVPLIQKAAGAETVGGLGGDDVDKLTRVLDQLPDILAELEVDPAVVDLVTKLSKQGHTIGAQLNSVEAICPGGVCGTANGENAKAVLASITGPDITAFLNDFKTLDAYLQKNPNALDKFPEAYGIIRNQVEQIQQLVAGLNAQDKMASSVKVIPPTTRTTTTTRKNTDFKTWGGKPIVTNVTVTDPARTEITQVKTGVTLGNVNSGKVRQSSNNICDQGGNDCVYRSYKSDKFEPI